MYAQVQGTTTRYLMVATNLGEEVNTLRTEVAAAAAAATGFSTWNGSAYVPPAGSTPRFFIGPVDPGSVPAGSVWITTEATQLPAGVRAAPGTVGFLGNPATLKIVNANDSFVGTVFEGTASSWDDGSLLVRGDNLVADGYRFNAPVVHVGGTNFTIRNSIVTPGANVGSSGVSGSGPRGTLTVEDTTIVCAVGTGPGGEPVVYGTSIISDDRVVARRVDVSGSGDGIHVCGFVGSTFTDGSIVSQCCVHDLSFLDVEQHCDGIQVYNTSSTNTTTDTFVLIEHNYVAHGMHGPVGEPINASITLGKPPADNTGPFIAAKVHNNGCTDGIYHIRINLRTHNCVVTNNSLGQLEAGEVDLIAVELVGSIATWSGNVTGTGNDYPNPNP